MESSQLLLTTAITITTILVVMTGLQLMFVLKELRRALKDSRHKIWRPDRHEEKEIRHKEHGKKSVTLHSVIDKIRILVPSHSSSSKKFFIKDK